MIEKIKAFLSEQGIEAAEALPFSAVPLIRPDILERSGLTPGSVVVFLLPYYAGETVNLSRYAAARDYHVAIRETTGKLIAFLNETFPGSTSVGFGDHSPIDERAAALFAGLGILGDNGLIVHEKYGSYVFISEVLTDVNPNEIGAVLPKKVNNCEHCGRCKAACPTGILRGENENCLSAITQRKGELTAEEAAMMRKYRTVWGCDFCQSACPHNRTPKLSPILFFRENLIPNLTSEILSQMDKTAFSERAFAWRGRKTVERNVALYESSDSELQKI